MDLWSPGGFVRLHLAVFVALLFLSVAVQLLSGAIRTRGLLRDKHDGRLSPGRIQLMVVTLTGAGVYLGKVLSDPAAGDLPAADAELIMALGGSHALYLAGKAGSALRLWSRLTANR